MPKATIISELTVIETLQELFIDTSIPPVLTHDGLNSHASLNDDDLDKVGSDAFELSSGAATIDLTAFPGTNNGLQDGTGLKVKAIKVRARKTNAGDIIVSSVVSNGYDLLGNDFTITLMPGHHVLFFGNDATPVISPTSKIIDLIGTGSDVLEVSLVMG